MKKISLVQHILVAFIALVVSFSIAGTTIVIPGVSGNTSYNLYESDRSRSYEDSYLFNNILGNNLADLLRHVAIRSQLETQGQYDDRKKIDVTAYVNRGTTLSGDYVTAVYYLSDLLKWAQNGFNYETKNFTQAESADYLSKETTYTHLKNNLYSGGMNSYLNSQIEGNSVTFKLASPTEPSGGEHTFLLSRYQTVDGKNIENLVSSWEEYSALSSSVVEAATDLFDNYEAYSEAVSYYSFSNSNLRYCILRTIGGKTEIFTNISELAGETTGKDIKTLFMDYGRYIYYCPYELSYETNTLIKENVLRSIIKNYNYAYPDQIKMYIAVDTKNYGAEDSFSEGRKSFTRYMPYRNQLYFLCILAAMAYIVLLFICIRKIPKATAAAGSGDGRDVVLSEGDVNGSTRLYYSQFATEGIVLLGLLLLMVPLFAIWILKVIGGGGDMAIQLSYFPIVFALSCLVADIGFLGIVYGITEKAKNGRLWSDSFLKIILNGAKNLIISTTDNGNVIIRTWIPYIFFVVLNFVLYTRGFAGIFIAAILDIIVGVYIYNQNLDRDRIIHVIENIMNGDIKAKVDVSTLHSDNIALANAVNSIGEGINRAVNTSMKDEKMKADLITNVSHDIKTPLTSIINYIDLIKREDIDNEKVKEYVRILDMKSQKLKQLTEDLVDVSKISSGNISITLEQINFVELVNQTLGEFDEKLSKSSLAAIFKPQQQNMVIMADPRHLWRVIENLLNNVCKYALQGTRVYLDMHIDEGQDGREKVVFSIKNISASELNIEPSELTERFIRGDESRTTEGSGLGLSIAKNLTIVQGGTFDIKLDGDLFKVIIKFNKV
ncbi:MAG: HAMP domain-containing histidine kinase [Butyrivibrio sp.]|nr:HAMP domain-containing histidine kinase [Butyrivibrio sp.]